ncbi:MAG: hypothetical protein KC458_05195 [Dehalococcoidia bacterium]|nr:hypothetical protein [Dehalococcoidia bacterium]MCB9483583.1 hypothetical protein [Dehalococcoidia bacterium]MCB9492451.1 hypothetical protein [Dehalococcoidia bacterium]
MNVELSAPELELLVRVVRDRLGDYSMQISDTDDSKFRETLRAERGELQGILDRLVPAKA